MTVSSGIGSAADAKDDEMDHVGKIGFFSFAKLSLPDPPRKRFTGVVLKGLGWFQVALLAMALLSWSLALLPSLVVRSVMLVGESVRSSTFEFIWMVWVFAAGLGFLYWISWTYASWLRDDQRARRHVFLLGIVATLGVVTLPARDPFLQMITGLEILLGISLCVAVLRSEIARKPA